MGAAVALPAIASGIGLWQNHENSRRQRNAMNQANDYNRRAVDMSEDRYYSHDKPINDRLLALANSYDPAAEAQSGITHASGIAEDTIKKALSSLRADYAKGGGTPGQSSEYGVKAQGTTNRAADPFRQYLAEATGNPTLKRMQALRMALGQANSGQLSDSYFEASRNAASLAGPGGDFSNVSRMIADLVKMLPQKSGGGSGDLRGSESSVMLDGNGYGGVV